MKRLIYVLCDYSDNDPIVAYNTFHEIECHCLIENDGIVTTGNENAECVVIYVDGVERYIVTKIMLCE